MEVDKDGPVLKFGSGYELRFEDDPELDEAYRERAENELGETPERRAESLEELRRLIREEKNLNLPTDDTTELYLLAFLRVCKFYPESAFKRVKSLYKLRQKNPKYCKDLIPSIERNIFDQNILSCLPSRDQHGRRITILECGQKWKVKNCSLVEIFRGIQLVMEAAIHEPKTQVAGVVLLVDFVGLSLNQVWQFTPNFAKMVLDWIQYSVPARLKEVHIVNQPYLFNMVFAVFKPFMQEKLRNRITFHGYDSASLLTYFDAKCLPVKYGGLMDVETDQSGEGLWNLLCYYEDKYMVTTEYGYKKKK